MLLNRYDQNALLTNANIKEKTTTRTWMLIAAIWYWKRRDSGFPRQTQPHCPSSNRCAVGREDKIIFISGFLEKLEYLPLFYEKYAADVEDDLSACFMWKT